MAFLFDLAFVGVVFRWAWENHPIFAVLMVLLFFGTIFVKLAPVLLPFLARVLEAWEESFGVERRTKADRLKLDLFAALAGGDVQTSAKLISQGADPDEPFKMHGEMTTITEYARRTRRDDDLDKARELAGRPKVSR